MMPTGFRFNPTDEELIEILERKVNGHEMPFHDRFIFETDLYEFDPQDFEWDHKIHNMLLSNNERYCCCLRENDSREVCGRGWWRSTGHVAKIYNKEIVVGYKRPLTFLRFMDNDRKRSKAVKTNWIMHEYKLASNATEWRLCKIKYKGKASFQEELENIRNSDVSRNNYLESSSSTTGMGQSNFVGEQQQQQHLPLNINSNVCEPYFKPSSSMDMQQFGFSAEEQVQSQPLQLENVDDPYFERSSSMGMQHFDFSGKEQLQLPHLQLENVYEPCFTRHYLEQEFIGGQQFLPQAAFDHPFYFDYQPDSSQICQSSYSLAFDAPGKTS